MVFDTHTAVRGILGTQVKPPRVCAKPPGSEEVQCLPSSPPPPFTMPMPHTPHTHTVLETPKASKANHSCACTCVRRLGQNEPSPRAARAAMAPHSSTHSCFTRPNTRVKNLETTQRPRPPRVSVRLDRSERACPCVRAPPATTQQQTTKEGRGRYLLGGRTGGPGSACTVLSHARGTQAATTSTAVTHATQQGTQAAHTRKHCAMNCFSVR